MSDKSDGTHREPAVSLERPARLRPSRLRRLAWLAAVLVLGAAILRSDLVDRGSECAVAVYDRSQTAVQICRRDYERTQDPTTGMLLAKALNSGGDSDSAKHLATRLLPTPEQSDAFQLLGDIALREGRLDYATTALETARELHIAEHRPRELARDDGVLASVQTERSEFAAALRLLDECITLTDDASTQGYCHTTAARTLIQAGYFSAAEHELDLAKPLATTEDARINLEAQRCNFEQESGYHASAIACCKKLLQRGERSLGVTRILKIELSLAYSLAEAKQLDEAQLYLKSATLLDSNDEKKPERTWVAAQLAYRRHDLMLATSLTETYFQLRGGDDSVDRDDQLDVATLRARIELERGDVASAERWAARGVDQAERVRGAQSALELRSWVLTKRRAPYELRFTALARSGQVEAAARAFDQWQGRTVQDALATPRSPAPLDYRGMAEQLTRLGAWLSVVSQAAVARAPDRESVLSTMRGIDLLALIVANDEVWRLTASHGPPRLSSLGSLAEIQDLVGKLPGHATEVELASRLGALLLPDDVFRATNEVLHVVVDGRLGGLAVAALRHGATPLIAMRPIVRVLRLPEIRCVHAARPGHATVLAGPDGKREDMRVEAEWVAGLLHTISKTGAAATRAALFAAEHDAVLHVAAHGAVGMDGAAIVLADGEVPALEIAARRVAPSLAVLSACDSATSSDSELAGSLAAAFLAAGSQHVVATLRPISDAGAPKITTEFYRAGGVADPARALAIAQSALASTSNTDWPYFTVFGPDVCLAGPPDPR